MVSTSEWNSLRCHSLEQAELSKRLIDNFLVPYAAPRENLEKEMVKKLKPVLRMVHAWSEQIMSLAMGEYITFQLFREGGLIKKYLNHSAIKSLMQADQDFLSDASSKPWGFSFIRVVENPVEDIFMVQDILTLEEYVLHSPSIQKVSEMEKQHVWLIFRGFNGKCWTCYGLNICLPGIDIDDLYFYATEMDPEISTSEEIRDHVHKNPFHWLILLEISQKPVVVFKDKPLRLISAEDEIEFNLNEKSFGQFEIQEEDGVYQLALKTDGRDYYKGTAYFDQETGELYRFAIGNDAFDKLTQELITAGMDIPKEYTVSISPITHLFVEDALDRTIDFHPYRNMFLASEIAQKKIDQMNDFLSMAIPIFNAGSTPDLEDLADEAGIDLKLAQELWKNLEDKRVR